MPTGCKSYYWLMYHYDTLGYAQPLILCYPVLIFVPCEYLLNPSYEHNVNVAQSLILAPLHHVNGTQHMFYCMDVAEYLILVLCGFGWVPHIGTVWMLLSTSYWHCVDVAEYLILALCGSCSVPQIDNVWRLLGTWCVLLCECCWVPHIGTVWKLFSTSYWYLVNVYSVHHMGTI